MRRMKALLSRMFRREPLVLPEDPFGEPGGPVAMTQTPDSVAFSQLPVNTMRTG